MQIHTMQQEVADLMKSGQPENARIRVEELIRQEKLLQAYATLETYLLLLQTRAAVLKKEKEPPQDMREAICTLFFCADRVRHDLDEIPVIAEILMTKFRTAFIKMYEDKDFPKNVTNEATAFYYSVNMNLVGLLSVQPAAPQQKIDKLEEIAEKFNAPFDKATEEKALMVVANNIPLSSKPPTLPSVYQSSMMGDSVSEAGQADRHTRHPQVPPSHLYTQATAPVSDSWQAQGWDPVQPPPQNQGYDFSQKIAAAGAYLGAVGGGGFGRDAQGTGGKEYAEELESEGFPDDQDSVQAFGSVRSRGGDDDQGGRASVDSSLAAKLEMLRKM